MKKQYAVQYKDDDDAWVDACWVREDGHPGWMYERLLTFDTVKEAQKVIGNYELHRMDASRLRVVEAPQFKVTFSRGDTRAEVTVYAFTHGNAVEIAHDVIATGIPSDWITTYDDDVWTFTSIEAMSEGTAKPGATRRTSSTARSASPSPSGGP